MGTTQDTANLHSSFSNKMIKTEPDEAETSPLFKTERGFETLSEQGQIARGVHPPDMREHGASGNRSGQVSMTNLHPGNTAHTGVDCSVVKTEAVEMDTDALLADYLFNEGPTSWTNHGISVDIRTSTCQQTPAKDKPPRVIFPLTLVATNDLKVQSETRYLQNKSRRNHSQPSRPSGTGDRTVTYRETKITSYFTPSRKSGNSRADDSNGCRETVRNVTLVSSQIEKMTTKNCPDWYIYKSPGFQPVVRLERLYISQGAVISLPVSSNPRKQPVGSRLQKSQQGRGRGLPPLSAHENRFEDDVTDSSALTVTWPHVISPDIQATTGTSAASTVTLAPTGSPAISTVNPRTTGPSVISTVDARKTGSSVLSIVNTRTDVQSAASTSTVIPNLLLIDAAPSTSQQHLKKDKATKVKSQQTGRQGINNNCPDWYIYKSPTFQPIVRLERLNVSGSSPQGAVIPAAVCPTPQSQKMGRKCQVEASGRPSRQPQRACDAQFEEDVTKCSTVNPKNGPPAFLTVSLTRTRPAAISTVSPAKTGPQPISTLSPATTGPAAVSTVSPATTGPQPLSTVSPATTGPQPISTMSPATIGPAAVSTVSPATTGPQPISTVSPATTGPAAVSTVSPATTGPQPISTVSPATNGPQPISTVSPASTGLPAISTISPAMTGPSVISAVSLAKTGRSPVSTVSSATTEQAAISTISPVTAHTNHFSHTPNASAENETCPPTSVINKMAEKSLLPGWNDASRPEQIFKERPFNCKICLKWFRRSDTLKEHMVSHTGEKRHECDVCGKRFMRRQHMKHHKRSHQVTSAIAEVAFTTGERQQPFIDDSQKEIIKLKKKCVRKDHTCGLCQKGFRSVSRLKAHILTHTDEKPHKCELCQQRFKSQYGFKKHMKLHERKTPYRCAICNTPVTFSYRWVCD